MITRRDIVYPRATAIKLSKYKKEILVARVKKFELSDLDKQGWSSAQVNGKWRGLVERTGLRSYRLHLGKNDVTNFSSKKALETWLTDKWA